MLDVARTKTRQATKKALSRHRRAEQNVASKSKLRQFSSMRKPRHTTSYVGPSSKLIIR
ncbi:hypothetical protein AKJ09_02329 [Labilithrix luteola]|uniref:Uncharacterized protein n=1 Tax=Labilithrix luteola TaxID=1391654 RepID=A0A0K1PQ41_9BACT|nr:hypothetical protein AKJ09_02329 [Labilithrix luteola]